jgi:DNA-binding NarL/FixJ family response regulator
MHELAALKVQTTSEWVGVLSRRQREVMGCVVLEGMTTPRIAQRLHVSPETVKSHLTACFDTLGVRGVQALTIAYWEHRVADLTNARTRVDR